MTDLLVQVNALQLSSLNVCRRKLIVTTNNYTDKCNNMSNTR